MMEGFNNEPIYAALALLGTTLFVVKMILMLLGGDSDSSTEFDDASLDTPTHVDGGESFSLVSVQSILAFFMGAGWVGLACREEFQMEKMPSMISAIGFGFLMMLMSSFLTMKIRGLNANPVNKIDKTSIGKTGRAYTNIPEKGKGMGQVEITINDKQQIIQASSDGDSIQSFATVKVVDVDDSGNLTVTGV